MRYSRLNYLLFITVLFFCFLVKNEVMNSASEGKLLSSLYDINDVLLFDDDHAFFNQESMMSSVEVEWGGFKGTYDEGKKYLSLKGHPDMESVDQWIIDGKDLDEYWVNQDIKVSNNNGIIIDKSEIKTVDITDMDFSGMSFDTVLLRYWFASQIDTNSQPCADDNKKHNYFCSLEEVIGFDQFEDKNEKDRDVVIDITGLFFGNQHIKKINLGSHFYLTIDGELNNVVDDTFYRTFGKMPQLEEVTIPIINLKEGTEVHTKFVDTFLEDKKLQKISFRKVKGGSTYNKVRLNLKASGLPQSKDRETSTDFYKQPDSQWIIDGKQQDIMSDSGISVSIPLLSKKVDLEWQPQGNDIKVISDIKSETKKNMGLYGYAEFSMSGRTIKSIKDDQDKILISKDQLYKNEKSAYPDFYIEDNQLYIKSTKLYTQQNTKEYHVEFEPIEVQIPTEGTHAIEWNEMKGEYNFNEKKLTIIGGRINQDDVLENGVLEDLNSFWETEKIILKDSGGVISKYQIEKVEFKNQINTFPEDQVSLNYMFASKNSKGEDVCNSKEQQDNYFCSLKQVEGLEKIKTKEKEDMSFGYSGVSVSNLFMNNSGIECVDLGKNNYLTVEEFETAENKLYFADEPLYVATFKQMHNLKEAGLSFVHGEMSFEDTFAEAEKLQKITFHLDEVTDPNQIIDPIVSFKDSGIVDSTDRVIDKKDKQSEFFKLEDSSWIDREAEQAYPTEVLDNNNEIHLITDDEEEESLDRDTISLEWQPQGQGISLRSTSGSLEEEVDTIGLFSYAAFKLPEDKTIEDIDYIKTPDGEQIDEIKIMSSDELYLGYKNPPYYIDNGENTLYIKSLKEYQDGSGNAVYEIKFKGDELEVPEDGSRLIEWNSMEGRYYEDDQKLLIIGGKISQNLTHDFNQVAAYWAGQPIKDKGNQEIISKSKIKEIEFQETIQLKNEFENNNYIYLTNLFAKEPILDERALNQQTSPLENVCRSDHDQYFCHLETVKGLDKLTTDWGKKVNIDGLFSGNDVMESIDLRPLKFTITGFNKNQSLNHTFSNMSNLKTVYLPKNIQSYKENKIEYILLKNSFKDDKKLEKIIFSSNSSKESQIQVRMDQSGLPNSTDRDVDKKSFYKKSESGWINEEKQIAYKQEILKDPKGLPILISDKQVVTLRWQPQGNNLIIKNVKKETRVTNLGLYDYAAYDLKEKIIKTITYSHESISKSVIADPFPPNLMLYAPQAYVNQSKVYLKSMSEDGNEDKYVIELEDLKVLTPTTETKIKTEYMFIPTSLGNETKITKCSGVRLPQPDKNELICKENGKIIEKIDTILGAKEIEKDSIDIKDLLDHPFPATFDDLQGIDQKIIDTSSLKGHVSISSEKMRKGEPSYLEFADVGLLKTASGYTPVNLKVTFQNKDIHGTAYRSNDIHQLGYISLFEEDFLSVNMPYRHVYIEYEFKTKEGKSLGKVNGNMTLESEQYRLKMVSNTIDQYYFSKEDLPLKAYSSGSDQYIYNRTDNDDPLTWTFKTSDDGKFNIDYISEKYPYSTIDFALPEIPIIPPSPVGDTTLVYNAVTPENKDQLYMHFQQYIPYLSESIDSLNWSITPNLGGSLANKEVELMDLNLNRSVVKHRSGKTDLGKDFFNIDSNKLSKKNSLSYNGLYDIYIPLDFKEYNGDYIPSKLTDKQYALNKYKIQLEGKYNEDTSLVEVTSNMETQVNFKAKITQKFTGINKTVEQREVYLTQPYPAPPDIDGKIIFLGSTPPVGSPILFTESTITYDYAELSGEATLSQLARWKNISDYKIPALSTFTPLYSKAIEIDCNSRNNQCSEDKNKNIVTLDKKGSKTRPNVTFKNIYFDGNSWVDLNIENESDKKMEINTDPESYLSIHWEGDNTNNNTNNKVKFKFFTKNNKGKTIPKVMNGYLSINLSFAQTLTFNPNRSNQIKSIYTSEEAAKAITYRSENKTEIVQNLYEPSKENPVSFYMLFEGSELDLTSSSDIQFKVPEVDLEIEMPEVQQMMDTTNYDFIDERNKDKLEIEGFQFIPYNPRGDGTVNIEYNKDNIMKHRGLLLTNYTETTNPAPEEISLENNAQLERPEGAYHQYYKYKIPIQFPDSPVDIQRLDNGYSDNKVSITVDENTSSLNTKVNFKSRVRIVVKLNKKSWGMYKRKLVYDNNDAYITRPFPKEHIPPSYEYKGVTYVITEKELSMIPDYIRYTDERIEPFYYKLIYQIKFLNNNPPIKFTEVLAGSRNLVPIDPSSKNKQKDFGFSVETNLPKDRWHVMIQQEGPLQYEGNKLCESISCFTYKSPNPNKQQQFISLNDPARLTYQDFNENKDSIWTSKWEIGENQTEGIFLNPKNIPKKVVFDKEYKTTLSFILQNTL